MIYNHNVKTITGKNISLKDYKNKVLLIVNIATNCGFASQLEDLEELYRKYKDKDLVILGFPCNQFANQEKGTDKEIAENCKINFGVSFPLFSKIKVNGEGADSLYKYIKSHSKSLFSSEIKWNFTKFLVDKNGNIVNRYSPSTKINKIEKDLLKHNFV